MNELDLEDQGHQLYYTTTTITTTILTKLRASIGSSLDKPLTLQFHVTFDYHLVDT